MSFFFDETTACEDLDARRRAARMMPAWMLPVDQEQEDREYEMNAHYDYLHELAAEHAEDYAAEDAYWDEMEARSDPRWHWLQGVELEDLREYRSVEEEIF